MCEFDYSSDDIFCALSFLSRCGRYLEPIDHRGILHSTLTDDDVWAVGQYFGRIFIRDGQPHYRPKASEMMEQYLQDWYPCVITLKGRYVTLVDALLDAFAAGSFAGKFVMGVATGTGYEVSFEYDTDAMAAMVLGIKE
jgi:hypothetical protein